MEPVRVLHVCDKFGVAGSSVCGVGRLFAWWLPRFDPTRYDVSLVALRYHDRAAEELERDGVSLQCLGRGRFDVRTLADLKRLTREEKPQILHLHNYGSSVFGRLAAGRTDIKCILHEHFVDPNVPVFQRLADRLLRGRIDAGVAVSESVKTFMVEERSMPAERVRVIYNGAPLAHFRRAEPQVIAECRTRYGLEARDFVVGTISRLDEQKGITYLIDAFAQVVEGCPECKLVIVGDGPLEADLRRQVDQKGLQSKVVFTGFLQDIRPVQSTFDVQAFPSLWEGTALTLFEAMAMGIALVTTNVDGHGEILEHGRTAWLTPPRDAAALADGIIAMIKDPELRKTLAANALALSSTFDIDSTVQQLEALYDSVLAGGERLPDEAEELPGRVTGAAAAQQVSKTSQSGF